MAERKGPIPIIDLFAGPGGLGEGFSSVLDKKNNRIFQIKLSIEKDEIAHKTLTLRAFFRQFPKGKAPVEYYEYLRGNIDRYDLFSSYPKQAKEAQMEARCLTLGKDDVSKLVGKQLRKDEGHWVLIGGPPCQAYSLVGRSRMTGKGNKRDKESDDEFESRIVKQRKDFAADERQKLYREYLTIIADHWPSVFVMENVKGVLSAKVDGSKIFPRIREDLQNPCKALERNEDGNLYELFSLVVEKPNNCEFKDNDFLIKAENYGIPQARHRVILLGVRKDIAPQSINVLTPNEPPCVSDMLHDLPPLSAGLSKEKHVKLGEAVRSILNEPWWPKFSECNETAKVASRMTTAAKNFRLKEKRNAKDDEWGTILEREWFYDERLTVGCNHETRTHMRSDLWRYLFCVCYAKEHGKSPHLRDFPAQLLPKHKNVKEGQKGQKFGDRFRVQVANKQATTITSHISKDGHYFIHPDPTQCRSLTVREAARLQTFPDNYLFEGGRTQQYHQVGNAVPPQLARDIAVIVKKLLRNDAGYK